jgi:hypothetical protein
MVDRGRTPLLPSKGFRTSLLRSDPMPPSNVGHDDTVNQTSSAPILSFFFSVGQSRHRSTPVTTSTPLQPSRLGVGTMVETIARHAS